MQYDLDLSVERGVWATQKHNEVVLDQAYRTSKEVLLIFSVNKSGEFYGYARSVCLRSRLNLADFSHHRMAGGILRSSYSVSWAPRADTGTLTSSPSPIHLPSRGVLESKSPQRPSPEISSLPSESQVAATIPPLLAPSLSEASKNHSAAVNPPKVKFVEERRSAPPALRRGSEDSLGSKPPLRSSFSCSHKGWPVTSQVSKGPDPLSDPPPEKGKHLGAGGVTRSKRDGVDDGGGQLQPVMEEARGGSSAEEDPLPAPAADPPEPIFGRSVGQQGETGWGETFKVEWLRTERVPFQRTRHLRNPWNHGREVKVARDGTEVEPSVGQQLIEEWPTLAGSMPAGVRGARVAPPGHSGESKRAKR